MSEDKQMQVAVTEKTPPVKTAWLDVQYWPDEMYEDLMRMRVTLSINGSEYVREIQSHLFDKKKGNGIISHGTNLTWLIHESAEIARLKALIKECEEHLDFSLNDGVLSFEVRNKARALREKLKSEVGE